MEEILMWKDRTKAGKTAPPGGLYQLAVHYPPDLVSWSEELLINPFKLIDNSEECSQ